MASIKKTIVAVDGSIIVLKMLINALGDKYEMHVFNGGRRELWFLKDRAPNLIILDIDMPEINGYEMLEMIKEKEHLKDVPVIFLTSDSDESHVAKAVADGAKDYVVKPIEEDILLEKVHAALGDDSSNQLVKWIDL